MRVLFFIGNGFDLNLGMKTRYSDFYKFYKDQPSESKVIKDLKENITKDITNWSDLELDLGKYTSNIKDHNEFEILFEDIVDQLSIYLEQVEKGVDFDVLSKSSILNCLIEPENLLLERDRNILREYRNKFTSNSYRVNVITFNYTKSFENITGFRGDSMVVGTINAKEVCLDSLFHIHGYTNERMVLGVNDADQIQNPLLQDNEEVLEAFVKNRCNQVLKHTIEEKCSRLIEVSQLICIYGSSIGLTDKIWWEKIANRLLRNGETRLIIFEKTNNLPRNREYKIGRLERRIKRKFLEKTNLSTIEKERIEDRIFIGINTEMFNMKEEEVW